MWQQLKLASELKSDLQDTVDWGMKWLVDFKAGKTQLVLFDQSNITGGIMLKWLGLLFSKNHLLRSRSCRSLLNLIGALTLSQLVKLPPKKLESWFVLWSFFLQRLLCISINLSHDLAWNIFVMSGQVRRTVGPSLAASLEPLVHHPNAASLSLFYRYYLGRYSSELAKLASLPYSHGKSSYSDRLHDISVTIPWCYKNFEAKLWNSVPIKCFPLIYNLNGFMSIISWCL